MMSRLANRSRGKGLAHLGDQLGVGEHRRLDGGHDALLPLRGPAGEDLLAADEQAVVDDEIDAEAPRHLARLEALARAALADEGNDAAAARNPGQEAVERGGEVHAGLTGEYTPAAGVRNGGGPCPAGRGFRPGPGRGA